MNGVSSAMNAARTKISSPDSVAVKPSTPCTYCGKITVAPNSTEPIAKPSALPAAIARYLNARRSTSGRFVPHSSQQMNAAIPSTVVKPNSRITGSENQSLRCPSSRMYCSEPRPIASSAKPERVDRDRLRIGRVAHHRQHDDRREDPRHQVDEEHPVPRVVVGEPAADGRADRRADDRAEREHRLRRAEQMARKRVAQRRLRRRDEPAAEQPLDDAVQDELLDRARRPAQHRRDREPDDRDRIVLLAPEARLQPRRHRDDDHRRDDVARDDPGAFFLRGAEVALNGGERDVDDRGVERLHQRRGHDPEGDQDQPGAGLADVAVFDDVRLPWCWVRRIVARRLGLRADRGRFRHLHLGRRTAQTHAAARPDGGGRAGRGREQVDDVVREAAHAAHEPRSGCRTRAGRSRTCGRRRRTGAAPAASRRAASRRSRPTMPASGMTASSTMPIPMMLGTFELQPKSALPPMNASTMPTGATMPIHSAPAISASVPGSVIPPDRPVAIGRKLTIERGACRASVPISVAHVSAVAAAYAPANASAQRMSCVNPKPTAHAVATPPFAMHLHRVARTALADVGQRALARPPDPREHDRRHEEREQHQREADGARGVRQRPDDERGDRAGPRQRMEAPSDERDDSRQHRADGEVNRAPPSLRASSPRRPSRSPRAPTLRAAVSAAPARRRSTAARARRLDCRRSH